MLSKKILDMNDPLDQLVDDIEKHLAQEPTLFQRAGDLIQIENNKLQLVRTSSLRYLMSKMSTWIKDDKFI